MEGLMLNLTQGNASTLNVISNIVLIVGAVMALVGTFGAYWSSTVLSRYADQRSELNERLTAQANERAAQANADAERLRLQLKKMQEIRRLTNEQVTGISELLKSPIFQGKKWNIRVGSVSDAESQMYAIDFLNLLKSNGINIWPTPNGNFPREIVQLNAGHGVIFSVHSLNVTKDTEPLAHLFNKMGALGIDVSIDEDPAQKPGDAQINILRKPAI